MRPSWAKIALLANENKISDNQQKKRVIGAINKFALLIPFDI